MQFEELAKNQQHEAISNLIKVQELLGQLGYTLSGDQTYFKDYATFSGSMVRLVPVFDKGISLDMSYRLIGINVSQTRFHPLEDGKPVQLEHFPRECVEDVAAIVSNLAPHARTPVKEVFIITANCGTCGNNVSSFVQVDGTHTCLDCAGLA